MVMSELNSKILSREKLFSRWDLDIKSNSIFYISTVLGTGKTTAVLKWLKTRKYIYSFNSANMGNLIWELKQINQKATDIIVIDDLQNLANATVEKELAAFIENSHSKFILISRGSAPNWLKPFLYTRNVKMYGFKELVFSLSEYKNLLKLNNIQLSDFYIKQIYDKSNGWGLAIFLSIHKLRHGAVVNDLFYNLITADIFDCFDSLVLNAWDNETRELLLTAADFFPLSEELAELLLPEIDVQKTVRKIVRRSSFLAYDENNCICLVFDIFKDYLKKKQGEYISKEKIAWVQKTGAEYYEQKGNIHMALQHYSGVNRQDKISLLLKRYSKRHPGIADFNAVKKYYFNLPENIIKKSPELISGMAMVCSLGLKCEESERWMRELKEYINNANKHSSEYKTAVESLAYLNIALPHRGSNNILQLITNTAKFCVTSGVSMREFSISGNMPSIMNGSKDFCEWSKHDRGLYKTAKKPIEIVLGKRAQGFAEISIGESLYEKGVTGNLTEAINWVNLGISQLQANENIELEFVGKAVLSKIYTAQANIPMAMSIIDGLSSKIAHSKNTMLKKNVESFGIRLKLIAGQISEVLDWLNNKAPNENDDFYVLDRYGYLLKIRVYIQQERYSEAISLIVKLRNYYEICGRIYGTMECNMLYAIVLYRLNNSDYAEELNKVLKFCEEYSFVRIIANEGAGVYDLLRKGNYTINEKFFNIIIKETKKQAVLYGEYLKPQQSGIEPLTESEKSVLKLISDGLNNKEIASLLNVTLPTVKFHASNIYKKLGVKNRVAAVKLIEEVGFDILK